MKFTTPILLTVLILASGCTEVRNCMDTPCGPTTTPPTQSSSSSSSSSSEEAVVPPPVVVPPPAVVDPELALIQEVVDDENAYREVNGQLPLAKGLQCTLYTVTPGQQTIVGATLTKKASWAHHTSFNQPNSSVNDGMNVLPEALRSQYKTWYKITCSGYLAITESQYLDIDSLSDDNLIVTLDGVKIINLDSNHGETLVSGSKLVRKGMRSIKIEYMQGAGSQSLVISKDGAPLDSKLFYR